MNRSLSSKLQSVTRHNKLLPKMSTFGKKAIREARASEGCFDQKEEPWFQGDKQLCYQML